MNPKGIRHNYGVQPETKRFLELILQRIERQGKTVAQVAREIDISAFSEAVAQTKGGKIGNFTLWKAIRIANALGINLGALQKEFKRHTIKTNER